MYAVVAHWLGKADTDLATARSEWSDILIRYPTHEQAQAHADRLQAALVPDATMRYEVQEVQE